MGVISCLTAQHGPYGSGGLGTGELGRPEQKWGRSTDEARDGETGSAVMRSVLDRRGNVRAARRLSIKAS